MRMQQTWVAVAAAVWLVMQGTAAGAEEEGAFVVRDYLGHTWRHECVTFALSEAQERQTGQGATLVDEAGRPTAYQVLKESQPARIAFLVDLEPFQKRTFRLQAGGPAAAATDLRVEETDEEIRLENRLTGIRIRKRLGAGQGPIGGLRLGSGKWATASLLAGEKGPTSYSASVTARGPVLAEAVSRAGFGEAGSWEVRFRLLSHEPVVLVDEASAVRSEGRSWGLVLSEGFAAPHLFYRLGKSGGLGRTGMAFTSRLPVGDKEPTFVLEPWLHWQTRDRQGTWLGLYNDSDPDLLALAALEPSVWVDPSRPVAEQAEPRVLVDPGPAGLTATFPLKTGRRRWLVGSLAKEACLAVLKEKDVTRCTPVQQYVIKHGDFPLDRVKEYVWSWPGYKGDHPRLFLNAAQLARHRAAFKADPAVLERLRQAPVVPYQMDDPIRYFLGTGDAGLGRHLAATAVEWMQKVVDMYLHQDDLVSLGFAPHHQTSLLTAMTLTDVVLDTAHVRPEERQRLLAQIAFVGYTVTRPDYWSPARGYAANPNMTTTVAAYQAVVAGIIPSHPMARTWMDMAMKELKDEQLETWSDANGGWLEAPHYAMVSYDYLLGSFLMAYNAGFNEYLYHPKMKKIAEWFAKITTPPDARVGGRRHRPPIGHTYLGEPTSTFGTVAYLWKERDPAFASQMQWMHLQGGAYPEPGIGGFFPTLAGYRRLLYDPDIPARAPAYRSELFPETGVILRSGFPSQRETQLYLIAGRNHLHYDADSGSITFWGKGRIVADDFGYYGYAPGEDHSLVVAPAAQEGAVMKVTAFEPGEHADYVCGQKQGWTRQVMLVKDPDPLGPNYVVLADHLTAPMPMTWRLWVTAAGVTARAGGAAVQGQEDVDTEIVFLRPTGMVPQTEIKTRRSGSGLYPDGRWGPMDSTQTGLIVSGRHREVTAVLYPRLKTETAPRMTVLAGGGGVRVETAAGTDYVFLSRERVEYRDERVRFEGTAGAALWRGGLPARPAQAGRTRLALGAAGRIEAGGEVLRHDRPARSSRNLLEGGDFEQSEQRLFPAALPAYGTTASLHRGNPGGGEHAGRQCLAITAAGGERVSHLGVPGGLYVDPGKTYRVRLKAFTRDRITVTIGGYASDGVRGNLPRADGTGTWQYSLVLHGPVKAWQVLETTIGPKGSGARYEWPAETVSTGLGIWLHGAGTLYVDDLVFEEVGR